MRSDRETEMQVLLELLADGGEDARRAVADVEAADSASEIEIAIAVDVFDDSAVGGSGENGRGVRRAARNGGFAAGHQGARLWSRDFGANLGGFYQRLSVLRAAVHTPAAGAAPQKYINPP